MSHESTFESSIGNLLLESAHFRNCSRRSLARLVPHARRVALKGGERLIAEGDDAEFAYLVLDGEFLVGERGGREQRRGTGLLGEEAALGLARYSSGVEALTPVNALAIPRAALANLAVENPGFHDAMLALYAGRFQAEGPAPVARKPAPRDGRVQLLGWLLVLAVPLWIYMALGQSMGMVNPQRLYFLMIGSATVVMWVFQLMPEFVPALFALLGVILLGLAPSDLVLSGFASDGFFIALSIFGLSAVISASGLSYRALLWLLRVGPATKAWYNFSLFITGLALTPVVPTTNGRVAIVAPFINDLLGAFGEGQTGRERKRFAVSALGGVSLLSATFLSSKSINFVVFGFLPEQDQQRFQWLYWFESAVVVGAVILPLFFLTSWLFYRNSDRPRLHKDVIREQLRVLGPMNHSEWAALMGLTVLAVSFATTAIHRIAVPWVALTILFWLLMFGFLDKRQFRERIDWSFLIFLGALIGLVAAMRHVGVDTWLAGQVRFLGDYMAADFSLFIAFLAGVLFLVRLALPINATVVVFATLLLPYASAIGVNPWLVGFLILFFSESFMMPYQASYYLQFTSMTGLGMPADDRRIVPFHFVITLMKLAAVYASLPYWREMGLL